MADSYYTVETCANDKGDIYYQRVQCVEAGVSETLVYWNAGRRVPAGTKPKHREFHTIGEAMRATMSRGRDLLHSTVVRGLREWDANQR